MSVHGPEVLTNWTYLLQGMVREVYTYAQIPHAASGQAMLHGRSTNIVEGDSESYHQAKTCSAIGSYNIGAINCYLLFQVPQMKVYVLWHASVSYTAL